MSTTAAAFDMVKHLRLGLVGNLRRIGAVGKAKGAVSRLGGKPDLR